MSLAASNNFFSTSPLGNWYVTETSELLGTANTRMSSQSTISVTRTSGTVLSIGNGASSSAPQVIRYNPRTRQTTAAVTLTINSGSGSGTVVLYGILTANSAAGALNYLALDTSGNSLSFSATGSVVEMPAASGLNSQPPPFAVPIWAWSITSGSWDSTNAGVAFPSGPIGDQQLSTDGWIDIIEAANTTGGAVTILAQDGLGTPIQLFPTVSLAANSVASYVHAGGRYFDGGLWLQAGTANAIMVNVRQSRLRRHQLNP